MNEGWFKEEYWTLCEDAQEANRVTAMYGIEEYLPGYLIVGLKSWDDFILVDHHDRYFTVPTVPLEREKVEPFQFPAETLRVEADERYRKKIKWYVKPIIFGGDPSANENMAWLSMEQHVEFVKWWNDLYFSIRKDREGPV